MKNGPIYYFVTSISNNNLWYEFKTGLWVKNPTYTGPFCNVFNCKHIRQVYKMIIKNPGIKFEIDVCRYSNRHHSLFTIKRFII